MRRNISIVSQETYIFEGTIYENIAYACEGASRADVVEAARSAGAHEFIVKLEEGYETKVGAGGHNLSGGEIDNIVRKAQMKEIVSGTRPTFTDITEMCKVEKLNTHQSSRRMGFAV